MAYSFSETCSSPLAFDLVPSETRSQLWGMALRAHRQACGAERAPSGWRPSASLLATFRRLLAPVEAFSYPAPGEYGARLRGVGEPDRPAWGDQLKRLEEDFVELSTADRELVIEFMKLLREESRLQPSPSAD